MDYIGPWITPVVCLRYQIGTDSPSIVYNGESNASDQHHLSFSLLIRAGELALTLPSHTARISRNSCCNEASFSNLPPSILPLLLRLLATKRATPTRNGCIPGPKCVAKLVPYVASWLTVIFCCWTLRCRSGGKAGRPLSLMPR